MMSSHADQRVRTESGSAPPPSSANKHQRELVIASLIRCPEPASRTGTA
jgi:hypothetical protein